MAPGVKIGRSPAPDAGSSAETGTWGFEVEELPELQGAEEPEDISSSFEGGALKDPKKADRRGNERSQEANSEGCKKIMTEKKSLGGEKKDGGAGTNLYRFEGPEERKQEMPMTREDAY